MSNRKKTAIFRHPLVGQSLSELAQSMNDLADSLDRLRAPFRRRKYVGKYEDCTVYEVRETTIRSHKRRGFVAVRVLRNGRKSLR